MDPTALATLGSTNVRVTRLGVGCAPIGGLYEPVEEHEAAGAVDRAFDLGIHYFDTAPLYGVGLSERRVGAALSRHSRESYVLSTKVGRLLRHDPEGDVDRGRNLFAGTPPLVPVFDFSYDGVMRSFEESLERLGLDRVDILYIHDADRHFEDAVSGAYRALDTLRREGRVGAIGVGMNQAEMPAAFIRETEIDCVLLAGRYTILEQGALDDLLPLCVERTVSIVIGGVFNSGVLIEPGPESTYNYEQAPPEIVERARRIQAVCREYDVPLPAAAIQFSAAHPAVASVLVGVRAAKELEQDVAWARHPIPADLWTDLKAEGLLREDTPVPAAPGEEAR